MSLAMEIGMSCLKLLTRIVSQKVNDEGPCLIRFQGEEFIV